MDTALNPKQTDPHHVLVARADEELAHAHEQIARADEQLARADEQLSKLEHDADPGKRPLLTGRRYAASRASCWQRASVSLPSPGSRPTAMRPERLSRGGRRSALWIHRRRSETRG